MDLETLFASLPDRHQGDVLVGLAGEAAVTADLREAEVACVRVTAPEVLARTDAEVLARTGIGRTLFIRIAVTMGETDFTQLVMGMARSEDVLSHFCDKAKTCKGGPGFPDLVLAGRRRVLFAELKRVFPEDMAGDGFGKRSDSQERWAAQLGDRCVLWTPLDLLHIGEDLRSL